FGLALLAEHEAEERGEVWGTPYYVAPEKLDHAPEDFRSDMYSLGGTLFHAIAGRPPFEADTASMVALKHLKSKAVSLQAFAPDVSSATAYVINRTLNKDPDQRYQSYAELIEHLEYARSQLGDTASGPRKPKQRVVVEGAGQQKAAGIMTLLMLLILIGVGVAAYKYRNNIFSMAGVTAAATPDPAAVAKHLQDDFAAARKQIAGWDFNNAVEAFRKLDDENENDGQPMKNWITLHRGIISLLNENEPDASGWFKKLGQYSHYSNDLADSTLVKFFAHVAETMTAHGPVKPDQASLYASDNVEALGPFIFAMKDWDLGHFTEAGKLLGQYLDSDPKEPFQWVADYKPVAQVYSDSIDRYEKIAALAAAADTPEKRADALKQAQDLQAQSKGKMAEALGKVAGEIQKKSASEDAAYNARMSEAKQQDQQALGDAKSRYAALIGAFHFDEAKAAIENAAVTGPEGQQEKQILLKKADWLRQFKAQLIQDINHYGYAPALFSRAGGALPEGPKTASDAGLIIQTQFGPVPAQWSTLTVNDLFAMANQFAASMAASAPQQAAERQWLAGVFACEEGLTNQGLNLLQQAAQTRDEYKSDLTLFSAPQQ
ncbi:MAG TPA: hypothetical protein VHY22_14825, partial [Chthoniobacteraceae bacterium]|nr:hypothetical protein [Chthoniobacteraceae bacterium]